MPSPRRLTRSPWLFVPSLYFQQGLPVILVQQFSILLYKKLGVANDQIVLWTSLLAWPWIIKMLWGPLVDGRSTKRAWTLAMQGVIVSLLTATAFSLGSTWFFPLSLVLLFFMAVASATHDIALDGFYLVSLPQADQAFFLGISNAFFRLAMIFCTGTMVILAGLLEARGWGVMRSWQTAVFAAAAIYAALCVYASFVMPRPSTDRPAVTRGAATPFAEAFRSFFSQRGSVAIVLFILVYRFGETMVTKMTGLFFLDSRANGGLGFDSIQTGAVLGSCGVVALVAGGVLGGAAIARLGLRACLWPMALVMHVPNLFYVWAAAGTGTHGPLTMSLIVGVDQFSYGFGLASYMVYTMQICQRSRFQASHYAIATGLMALGAMVAGIASGMIQARVGYFWFYVCVCAATLPGLFLLRVLPLVDDSPAGAADPVFDAQPDGLPA